MKKLAKTIAMVTSLLGLSEIPITGGKSSFSDDQKKKLKDKLGEDISEKALQAIDRELDRVAAEQTTNTELSAIRQELETALADTNISADEAVSIVQNQASAENAQDEAGADETNISLTDAVSKLTKQMIAANKKQDQLIQKLINDSEPDSPDAKGQINPDGKVKHSNTHLMASGKAYDSFDGRPWNRRAAEGISNKKTDWASSSGVEIQKLNGDLDLYFRENPDAIRSLHRDNFGLPSFWPKRTKVDDQVTSASIVSAEITQARKLPWLPKNNQSIKPETGKIFPVQIDIEFVGKMLQDLEASWLNRWVGGGSSPYKESFVRFLVSELDKKARTEDRISTIKGIYVETPDNATVAGRAINRQDGLLVQLYRAYYIDKKFKAANVGTPSKSNIVDYVPKVIEGNLKEEVKNETGLVYYLSPSWLRAYKTRYRQIHGLETDFDGEVMEIENYPNIRFVPLVDLEGSDFMFITFENNVEILENLPEEKSLYRFERLLRKIYVLGDYKLGVRMIHIGNKVKDTDPEAFKVQTVWTNGLPMFKGDTFVPQHDDKTGEVKLPYKNINVTDDWATDITKITGTYAGQVVKVRGNANMTATKNVKKNADLKLASDFDLKSGGTLTLYVNADGTLQELSRTTSPAVAPQEAVSFTGDTIDATDGSDQTFTGTAATTLAEIINGVEGQELTITLGAGASALTVNDVAGNVSVDSSAVIDAAAESLSLVLVDGVWTETARNITP